jgi:hypothetical protein
MASEASLVLEYSAAVCLDWALKLTLLMGLDLKEPFMCRF